MEHRQRPVTLIMHYWENESGEIEVSDLTTCTGLLPSIEVHKKAIAKIKESIRHIPDQERERISKNWEADFLQSQRQLEKKEPVKRPKGLIYVIKDDMRNFYKIGFTTNKDSRLQAIRTANPAISTVATYEGLMENEKYLHRHFKAVGKHIEREWFNLSDTDLTFISHYFAFPEKY